MLDTLFKKLNLPDSAFFKKKDFTDKVIQALIESEQNYGIYISGPKTLDLTKHSVLPVYGAWKENNFDDINFEPLIQGIIITSSNETGEVFFAPFVSESKKNESAIAQPLPPKTDSAQRVFQYEEVWRDLEKGIHFPAYNGHFTTFVLCGNYISNLYEFSIKNAQQDAYDSIYAEKIKKEKKQLSDKQRYLVSKSDKSPEPPDTPSIRLNVKIVDKLEPGRSYIISGSFCFNIADYKQYNQIPIHVILSGDTNKKTDIFEILVPLNLCEIEDEIIRGYFGFDIMERFYIPEKKTFSIPDKFCISVVHKNIIITPTEILLQ
jgi:hypothetical protein